MTTLPAERYRAAFEPGCSIGVLSRMLAPRGGTLLSCGLAAAADTVVPTGWLRRKPDAGAAARPRDRASLTRVVCVWASSFG